MISHSPPMPSCNTQIFFFYMSSVERESAIFADSAEKWHVDKISLIRNSVRQFSYKDFFLFLGLHISYNGMFCHLFLFLNVRTLTGTKQTKYINMYKTTLEWIDPLWNVNEDSHVPTVKWPHIERRLSWAVHMYDIMNDFTLYTCVSLRHLNRRT